VKVLPTLQIELASGARNVFAAGDIIEWPQEQNVRLFSFSPFQILIDSDTDWLFSSDFCDSF